MLRNNLLPLLLLASTATFAQSSRDLPFPHKGLADSMLEARQRAAVIAPRFHNENRAENMALLKEATQCHAKLKEIHLTITSVNGVKGNYTWEIDDYDDMIENASSDKDRERYIRNKEALLAEQKEALVMPEKKLNEARMAWASVQGTCIQSMQNFMNLVRSL